jgi:dTDP-4-amino-4,6-dideoxygalactose transaminase
MIVIPFNRPYTTGLESRYLQDALANRKFSGDGVFTDKCHAELERQLGAGKALLTTSCTDALEAAAILCDIKAGDEVIMPSYTFVSTANAFALRGATIKFVDSLATHPNMDHTAVEALISPRTRAIVPVHYAGVSCEMDTLKRLAGKYDLRVVEDAAQAIASTYREQPLGTIGDLAAFSYHETKNVIAGEGGSLHINDPSLFQRAEIVREKGTNRSAFFRGEIDKYGWVDIGSSFLPSELTAAFLLAQLEAVEDIQAKRIGIWRRYHARLSVLEVAGHLQLPYIPNYASNNAHMYYIVCESIDVRTQITKRLKEKGIQTAFHYQSLHKSQYFEGLHDGRPLEHADRYTDCLLRLPLYYELEPEQIDEICDTIIQFFN